MLVTDNRLEADRLEVTSHADWLERVIPTTTKMELNRILLEKVPTNNGLYTTSHDAWVLEFLVWHHDEDEAKIYRLVTHKKEK